MSKPKFRAGQKVRVYCSPRYYVRRIVTLLSDGRVFIDKAVLGLQWWNVDDLRRMPRAAEEHKR